VDAALARIGCPSDVVTLEPQRLEDVIASVATVAAAAGVPEAGTAVVRSLHARLAAVQRAIAGRPAVPTLVLEWLDPPFTAGHWVPDVVAAAGGLPLLGDAGRRSRASTWETVLAARPAPEVVILAPCGVPPADVLAQVPLVPAELLRRRTFIADLARPGPRLVDTVEALAAELRPGAGLPRRQDVLLPVTG
jgi:iron complex transport system substrate-binding protein